MIAFVQHGGFIWMMVWADGSMLHVLPAGSSRWWGSTIFLLALRFFDAIRVSDTNAFVINILRAAGQPAAAVAEGRPSPLADSTSSSDDSHSNETAGSHQDGVCAYVCWGGGVLLRFYAQHVCMFVRRADTLPLRPSDWTSLTYVSYLTTVIYLQVSYRSRSLHLTGARTCVCDAEVSLTDTSLTFNLRHHLEQESKARTFLSVLLLSGCSIPCSLAGP